MITYTLTKEDAHKAVVGGIHITVSAREIHVALLAMAEASKQGDFRFDFPRVLAELVESKTLDRRFKIKWVSATSSYRSGTIDYMRERVSWYHLNGKTEFEITVP